MTAIIVSHNMTSVSLNRIDNQYVEFEKSFELVHSKVLKNIYSIDSLHVEYL